VFGIVQDAYDGKHPSVRRITAYFYGVAEKRGRANAGWQVTPTGSPGADRSVESVAMRQNPREPAGGLPLRNGGIGHVLTICSTSCRRDMKVEPHFRVPSTSSTSLLGDHPYPPFAHVHDQ